MKVMLPGILKFKVWSGEDESKREAKIGDLSTSIYLVSLIFSSIEMI